jgi:hypothetical protein
MDILDELRELHKQATTERSHYYAGKVVQRAIAEIEAMRGKWGSGKIARITIRNPHKRKDIEFEMNGTPITLESDCSMDIALAELSGDNDGR